MNAAEVLKRCQATGVELTAAAGHLRFRAPAGMVDEGLRALLIAHKAEIIAALAAVCPTRGQPVDPKRRCWHCHNRACAGCGRSTGSAFIAHCWPCQHALQQAGRM